MGSVPRKREGVDTGLLAASDEVPQKSPSVDNVSVLLYSPLSVGIEGSLGDPGVHSQNYVPGTSLSTKEGAETGVG